VDVPYPLLEGFPLSKKVFYPLLALLFGVGCRSYLRPQLEDCGLYCIDLFLEAGSFDLFALLPYLGVEEIEPLLRCRQLGF